MTITAMVRLTKSVRTMAVFAIHFFLAPVFSRPPTAPARLDSFCPQCQFILFVERLQLSCHEPPVSRIVSASCIYNLLLYGSIGTYCECRCKSWDGLTLTHFHLFLWKLQGQTMPAMATFRAFWSFLVRSVYSSIAQMRW